VSAPLLVLTGAALVAILVAVVPRVLLGRAQDRLAARLLVQTGAAYKLLTRAELCAGGAYRRLPGVLGLTDGSLVFHGVFGEIETIPTERIQRIVTGTRLSNGRELIGREALRVTRSGGTELEFALSRASASAWRSHLGLWAVEERRAAMDVVAPGKK
jgi:hypothetical protein